jgi:serine/threonine protein phosphatase PrpC
MITSCPEITKFPRKGLHFIIMGCDGIWECRSSEQMTEWIRARLIQRTRLGSLLEDLLDELVAKDSKD